MFNPQIRNERLNNPIERSNPINEPDYSHEEGYNPFDITCPKLLSPRYGEVTPIEVFETVPADRHQLSSGVQTVLDRVQGRVMSDVRAHLDYFHVPLRSIFPVNYEKIMVNPVKGDDVPFDALPNIPLLAFLHRFLVGNGSTYEIHTPISEYNLNVSSSNFGKTQTKAFQNFELVRVLYVCYALSRGQLLDYLGFSLDVNNLSSSPDRYSQYKNELQSLIDDIFDSVISFHGDMTPIIGGHKLSIYGVDLSDTALGLTGDIFDFTNLLSPRVKLRYVYKDGLADDGTPYINFNLSSFRAALYDCFERGLYPLILTTGDYFTESIEGDFGSSGEFFVPDNYEYANEHILKLESFLSGFSVPSADVEDEEEYFDNGIINPSRIVAYQQAVAEYMSMDHVDNVFTAELWMQNMRALMFPSVSGVSKEFTFDYNGVDTEFDLFTVGAWRAAWFQQPSDAVGGFYTRALPFISNLLFMRRSLRYGDYFVKSRPNVLAVGDVSIPSDGSVSAIDVTKGIMLQRFFNAVNRWGQKFINYMAGLFGIKPSDTGCHPSFVKHETINLSGDTVANTAGDSLNSNKKLQGSISTNLVGNNGQFMFDCFFDDFGVCIGFVTYDTPSYYPSGVARAFRHRDRFTIFNPMLQNVGDQEVRLDELTGDCSVLGSSPFGYATRYQEYKIGVARAHGAFVNNLPAYAYIYGYNTLQNPNDLSAHINPDFIRESPFALDPYIVGISSISPGRYYHFLLSVSNPHSTSRKMEYWPGVL